MKNEITASIATGTKQPTLTSQMKQAIRIAACCCKKMKLQNPNERIKLKDCSFMSPQLHIASFVIRTVLELHCHYHLKVDSLVRKAIESELKSTADLQGNGVAVVTCRSLRLLIARYAKNLYEETLESSDLKTRFSGLLVLLTARFVQAMYTDTKDTNTLELRLMAHSMTMVATFFSAQVGGKKPTKFESAKYTSKHLAGLALHTNNLYFYASITLLIATAEMCHQFNVSIRGANEEHGERAIQTEHVNLLHVTRNLDLVSQQRLANVSKRRKMCASVRSVKGKHSDFKNRVPVHDVIRCSCLMTGECPLEIVHPKTGAITRRLPFFSFNNRAFDRQLTNKNNELIWLTRSGHTLFGVGHQPSKLRNLITQGGYVEEFDRAEHPDLLFMCLCGGCNLRPKVDQQSKTSISRDFNMVDLRTKLFAVSGVHMNREEHNTRGILAARYAVSRVAQHVDGRRRIPLFKFRDVSRCAFLKGLCGPGTPMAIYWLQQVLDRKRMRIADLSQGTNSWPRRFALWKEVDSFNRVVIRRALSDVDAPQIAVDRVMREPDVPIQRGPRIDKGYCACSTMRCKACICVFKKRKCTEACHGKNGREHGHDGCRNQFGCTAADPLVDAGSD